MREQARLDFIKLYDPVHQQFYRFCRAISGNHEDAQDLIQDTILNVMEQFDQIRDHSVFKSYLFSVASNLNKMKMRRLKFKAEFNEKEVTQIIDLAQDQEYLTDFKLVYDKILSLSPRMAETLILYHISDLTLEEIRKIQGGSLSGVKLRLKRGREKIMAQLNNPSQVKVALMLLSF